MHEDYYTDNVDTLKKAKFIMLETDQKLGKHKKAITITTKINPVRSQKIQKIIIQKLIEERN